jgi:hypothetical protein
MPQQTKHLRQCRNKQNAPPKNTTYTP